MREPYGPMKFSRRILLVSTGLAGGVAVFRHFFPSTAKAQPQFPADAEKAIAHTFQLLIDTIVPADEFAGAVDANIHTRLLERYQRIPVFYQRLATLVEALDSNARANHDTPFAALNLEKRTQLVNQFLLHGHGESGTGNTIQLDLSHITQQTISAFYTSPEGYGMLGYHSPARGGYPDYDAPPPA